MVAESQFGALAREGARFGAAIGLGLYAAGMVTINWYLQSIGYSDFELLRARSITTGSLFLLMWSPPFVLAVMIAYYFHCDELSVHQENTRYHLSRIATLPRCQSLLLALLWLVIVVIVLINIGFERVSFTKTTEFVLVGLLAAAPICLNLRATVGKGGSAEHTRINRYLCVLWVLLFAALGIRIFATGMVAQIPAQYGGLEPSEVVLVFNSDDVNEAALLGLDIDKDGKSDGITMIYWEASEYLIVGKYAKINGVQVGTIWARVDKNMLSGWNGHVEIGDGSFVPNSR